MFGSLIRWIRAVLAMIWVILNRRRPIEVAKSIDVKVQ